MCGVRTYRCVVKYLGFTVGKLYTLKDGIILDDQNHPRRIIAEHMLETGSHASFERCKFKDYLNEAEKVVLLK